MREDEQVREATTPNEMRAEIDRLSRHDAMVHKVMRMSNYNGLSGEDRYATLAYYALSERAQLKKLVLHYASMVLRPADIASLAPQEQKEGM